MQNKRPRPQAIDNFIPSGRPLTGLNPQRRRPASFPDVGVTMSPYRNGSLSPAVATGAVPRTTPHLRQKKRRWHWTKKRIIFAVLLPFLILGLWLGIKFGFNLSRIFDGNIFSIFSTTRLKGEDEGRVNFLLAGNSADDPGHNGGELTDSIMILSLDTRNNRAFMMSIPRDLYVDIPGYGHAKINETYYHGKRMKFKEAGYPTGGMGLLEKTVEEHLGVNTHYYALVNYSALREAVNAVGGVTVKIDSGSSCGLYDPSTDWYTGKPLVNLKNGVHDLNGQEALNLARARGNARGSCGYAQSDFRRTENQRLLLMALRNKVTSTSVLANPVKVSKLFDAVGKNVKTDMKLGEARRLNDLLKKINNNKIKSYGLNEINDKTYLSSYRTRSGQSALIPAAGLDNFTEIKQALRRLMSTNKVTIEDAKVVVLNATETNGLAGDNETLLLKRNITVTDIGDATTVENKTYIINNSGKSKLATLKVLKKLYGTKVTKKNPYSSKFKDADFIVILGSDRVASSH